MNIFDKIGIQAVILRCCTGLEPYWFKSYDKNAKKLDKLEVFYKIEKYFALKITDFLHLEDVKIPY